MATTRETEIQLREREEDVARARTALADAEDEKNAAAHGYAEDMTAANIAALDLADQRVRHARLNLEAFEKRAAAARLDHEAAVTAAKRARLAELRNGAANPARVIPKLQRSIAAFVEADRNLTREIQAVRTACADQRAARTEAVELAQELGDMGVTSELVTLHLDDVRLAAAIAVGRARANDGRTHYRPELFIFPVESRPGDMKPHEVTITLATRDAFDFASQLLNQENTK